MDHLRCDVARAEAPLGERRHRLIQPHGALTRMLDDQPKGLAAMLPACWRDAWPDEQRVAQALVADTSIEPDRLARRKCLSPEGQGPDRISHSEVNALQQTP